MDLSVWQRLYRLSQGFAGPVVALLAGLGLLARWGAALEHSSLRQVAGAVAPFVAVLLVVVAAYWNLRRQVRKAQADAALALHALRSPGPLHALLRLGALPGGYCVPLGEQSWEQREGINLGEAIGLLDVKRAPDGRIECYSWKMDEAAQKKANAAAAPLAALGEDRF